MRNQEATERVKLTARKVLYLLGPPWCPEAKPVMTNSEEATVMTKSRAQCLHDIDIRT